MPELERMPNNESISNEIVVYAFAHCETWLEDYVKSQRLSAHELTEQVAALLFGHAVAERSSR